MAKWMADRTVASWAEQKADLSAVPMDLHSVALLVVSKVPSLAVSRAGHLAAPSESLSGKLRAAKLAVVTVGKLAATKAARMVAWTAVR